MTNIWCKASLKTVSERQIQKMMASALDDHRSLMKFVNRPDFSEKKIFTGKDVVSSLTYPFANVRT